MPTCPGNPVRLTSHRGASSCASCKALAIACRIFAKAAASAIPTIRARHRCLRRRGRSPSAGTAGETLPQGWSTPPGRRPGLAAGWRGDIRAARLGGGGPGGGRGAGRPGSGAAVVSVSVGRSVLDAHGGNPDGIGTGELIQAPWSAVPTDLLDDPAQAFRDLGDGVLTGGHVHDEVVHVVVRRIGCLDAVEL